MKVTKRPVFYMLFFTGLMVLFILAMQPWSILHFGKDIVMLFPQGEIALEERDLLILIQVVMLAVVIPVYILTFIFSWKYRAQNPKGKYDPDLVDNKLAEVVWWGLPCLIILVISVITFFSTHKLDPYKPIASDKESKTIQVVALQWKWLFIYPEEKIATVNFVQLPQGVPIHFEITADAPMNSFWIPSLGGQIYAMPNMKTHLYLIANEEGDFRGSSANISGTGFSGMHFIARASSQEDFLQWVQEAQSSPLALDLTSYQELAAPSQDVAPQVLRLEDPTLFHEILMKYMHPDSVLSPTRS